MRDGLRLDQKALVFILARVILKASINFEIGACSFYGRCLWSILSHLRLDQKPFVFVPLGVVLKCDLDVCSVRRYGLRLLQRAFRYLFFALLRPGLRRQRNEALVLVLPWVIFEA